MARTQRSRRPQLAFHMFLALFLVGNARCPESFRMPSQKPDGVVGCRYLTVLGLQPITDANIRSATTEWLADATAAAAKYGAIGNWNVSAVTNMAGLFLSKTNFNDDISRWCAALPLPRD